MITLVLGAIACGHLYLEAKKRAESGFKWGGLALLAFFGPQIIASSFVDPMLRSMLHLDYGHPIQLGIATAGVVAGFWLFVIARKRLYGIARVTEEHSETDIVVDSYEIDECEVGSFSVSGKIFPAKKDAEAFVSLVQRMPD